MATTIDVGTIVIIASDTSKYYSRFGFIYKKRDNGRFGVKFSGGHMVSYSRKALRAAALTAPTDSPSKEDYHRVCAECEEYFCNPVVGTRDIDHFISRDAVTPQSNTDQADQAAPIPNLQIQALRCVIEQRSQQLSNFSLETLSQIRTIQDNVHGLARRQDALARRMSDLQSESIGIIDSASDSGQPDLVPMDQ